MIPIKVLDQGQTVAAVGSEDDDPDGRFIHATGQYLDFDAPWLAVALDRTRARYDLTVSGIVDLLGQLG